MRILAIGPGESTQWLFSREDVKIPEDVITIGMHRVFPYIKNIKLDYWTWGDPDAAIEGLRIFNTSKNLENLPTVIIPSYMETVADFSANCGTSPLTFQRRVNDINLYNSTISKLKGSKVKLVPNSYNTKTLGKSHKIFSKVEERFSRKNNYFGSVPFDGARSESNWAQENKFTNTILPICYYLGATEVYCIGFDNRGKGIKRSIPQSKNNPKIINNHLSKLRKWTVDWKDHHNMQIFSITPDRFTPNNTILDYISIEDLAWIN
mgnify:CR=1 FL=1